jgi:AraC family transcriptional regulator
MAVVQIALTVGFQTQAHFTTVFKRFVGCTPHRWRAIKQMPALHVTEGGARVDVPTAA